MLRHRDFERFVREPGLGFDEDDGIPHSDGLVTTLEAPAEPTASTADDPSPEPETAPPVLMDADGVFLAETAPESVGPPFGAALEDLVSAPAPSDDIDPAQILRDRPDVYAAFYREFFGPNNDRNSPAWADRMGGETPEDYARYWYETYGRYEGYEPSAGAAAPAEGSADQPQGRTTIDGIPLSKILSDRPDVFQAFFTEYYGQNNDRNSDAWVQRVGGGTVEDFANYWYNAHGRMEGYVPSGSRPGSAAAPAPVGAPDPVAGDDSEPLPFEDPSLDPWNHPAIYPDWQPPYPGWQPPTDGPPSNPTDAAAAPAIPDDYPFARPLVVHYTEDGIELVSATLVEIAAMRSLFDDAMI
jgi:hypothetical protein